MLIIIEVNDMDKDSKLMSIFGSIEDPRSHINQLHNLVDIFLIGIISVICGAETWKQMIEFANSKEYFSVQFHFIKYFILMFISVFLQHNAFLHL